MAKGKYQEWLKSENLMLLRCWARDGLTDEQLACKMGISASTFYDWLIKYPEISESIKKGKEIVDYEVENALLKRALGYKSTEIKMKNENGIVTETVTTVKDIPPDVGAAAFWLKNRRPDKWREKQEISDNSALEKLDAVLKEVKENALHSETK